MTIAEGSQPTLATAPSTERAPTRPQHSAGRRRSVKTAVILLILFDLLVSFVARDVNGQHDEVDRIRQVSGELADTANRTLLAIGATSAGSAIDTPRLSQGLELADSRWTAAVAPIAGSTIGVWAAAYDQHFEHPGRQPDVVVIGFVNDELEDQNQIDWASIGNLHTSRKSLGARWRSAPDTNSKFDVAASWASATIGNRSWLFDVVSTGIPDHGAVPRLAPGSSGDAQTFTLLSDFVRATRRNDTNIAVVALPTQRSYPLPTTLRAAVEEAGGHLIDLRLAGELPDDRFLSSASLSPTGAREVSDLLAAELNVRFKQLR